MEKLRKGNLNCCVNTCKNVFHNTSSEIKFYSFPKAIYKIEQRKMWIRWVQKINAHFVGNCSSSIQSSPSYVPSISSKKNHELSSTEKSSIQRFNRHMRRRICNTLCVKDNVKKVDAGQNTLEEPQEQSCYFDKLIEAPAPSFKINQEVQVSMFETTVDCKKLYERTEMFICTQYVHNEICHAQTQVYIPEDRGLQIVKRRHMIDKCCGSNIVQIDKAIGPDTSNLKNSIVCTTGFHGILSITKDQEMLDLGGVTLSTFQLLLKLLPDIKPKKISTKNRLLIFLLKMKTGMSFSAIGVLFCIHRTTTSRIFYTTLQLLRVACSRFIFWPCREVVQNTLPEVFKTSYKDCRVIIDCTEIKVEQPNTVENRVYLYSHYKKGFTVKILVGCTPSGLISFISNCYGGRTSDSQITINSGILDLLEPGDVVLADKGFPGIQTVIDENGKGALIVMPPFLRDPQFSAEDVERTYKVAKVRIHIERIMQRLRIYKILDKFSIDMLPHADNIVFMCGVLVNVQPPIIKNGDVDETEIAKVD
ncbi:uncharacterized protein LOC112462951 isoform X2 [Temnothorax curvispinosus]|uniref:Uncharacterized protein LOC112462951 isoform X2 n=1 Tax=Temnothorax curvispinosus TaxID=300111 RepID=A0A6J1QVZ0_9HYME|nr:uncharacterized protein LOC112462951 isoform X2 [Temnothorax curvispinosus]